MLLRDRLSDPWPHARTVDPKEIERFEALAEEWWDTNGKFRAIHDFNPVRRDFILDQIADHFCTDRDHQAAFAGLQILDVGCGAGLLCEPLAERGARVVGIDATARNVEIARLHAEKSGLKIDYRHSLAEHVLQGGETFDIVLNTEVVEHVIDPRQLMKECSSLLKPNGILIVATINRTLRSFAFAIVGAEYVLRWLPKGTHDWRRFLRPTELSEMIEPYGLEIRELTGVSFSLFSREWRLSGDASVNYMVVVTKRS